MYVMILNNTMSRHRRIAYIVLLSAAACSPVMAQTLKHAAQQTNHRRARDYATVGSASCGPRALLIICQKDGIATSLADLYNKAHTTSRGTTLAGLSDAAKSVGLKAVGVRLDNHSIYTITKPSLAWVDGNHYVAVISVKGSTARIYDPNKLREETISTKVLLQRSQGIFLLLSH